MFKKAVQKVICSKFETIFLIRIDVNTFNLFEVLTTTFVKYFFTILRLKLYCKPQLKTHRNRLCFILLKDFLSKMMKKNKK